LSGVNPKIWPIGEKGRMIVKMLIDKVASNKYFPGLLLKKGFLLLITSTINDAEITDSRNQPVRN
jgi:hypothetical protein